MLSQIIAYVNYGIRLDKATREQRVSIYSARMWIRRHLLAQAWFSPITVPSPLEHWSMMRPAPRAASWLSRNQQPRPHKTAASRTYQVAVAVAPSEGAQTFWPWMIVFPHFLKTVPETEPWHAWPPRAASSVMHLAASAVCGCISQY